MIYNYSKTINAGRLVEEIVAAGLPVQYINTEDEAVMIFFASALSPEQAITLDTCVSVHSSAIPPLEQIKRRVLECKRFGEDMMADFAAENVLLGLTAVQMGTLAQQFANAQLLISSGSLRLARSVIASATVSAAFTQERKDHYLALIDNFLAT